MKTPFLSRILLALACVGLLALPAKAAEMTISGAASLTNAFTELKGMFEKKHPGLTAHVNFAASNPLLKQIQEGAPVDVFASADQATMDKAVASKVVDPATRKDSRSTTWCSSCPPGARSPLIWPTSRTSSASPWAIPIPCPPGATPARP